VPRKVFFVVDKHALVYVVTDVT